MTSWISIAATALIALVPASAKDPPASGDGKEHAARLETLRKEVDDALAVYMKAGRSYKEGDPADKIDAAWNEFTHKWDANGPKVIELVRRDPKADASFQALEWIVTEPRNPHQPYGLQAVELLRDHHTTNPKIGGVCGALGAWWRWENEPVMEFLRTAARDNPDRTARGNATLALARLTHSKASTLLYQKKGDPKTVSLEAESFFDTVVAKYADCPNQRIRPRMAGERFKGTLGDEASAELFEIRHLAIGKVAPEIEAEDLDGRKFKLSDYRGKVVVLDFWGHW
jgi:hypothetical protein